MSPRLRRPEVSDGADLWRLARDAGSLDVNSPYFYLLWCRDFADTSVVATDDENVPVGFVLAYRRPEESKHLLVWQVAVSDSWRGMGIASRLLDHVIDRARRDGISHLETTVTPDNEASQALFESAAERHGVPVDHSVLFEAADFPEGHEPEVLYRLGPF